MARKNMSYFADERIRNNNPRFYEKMDVDMLRRQVKRIVKDVRNNLIEDQDLTYFTNTKIINACLIEAQTQWKTAAVTKNALQYYFNEPLNNGWLVYPGIDINQERSVTANEITRYTTKANLWAMVYGMFDAISNGVDIKTALSAIYGIDIKLFYEL